MYKKTYVLIKDLPDAKSGTELIFDGNDTYNYSSKFNDKEVSSWYRKDFVENNPEWFKLKEDKIQITINGIANKHPFYQFMASSEIPPDKYPSIKKAIEAVLNDEPVKVYMNFNVVNAPDSPRKYTEKELLDAEEKAFIAGRHCYHINSGGFERGSMITDFKYKDFSEYKNNQK